MARFTTDIDVRYRDLDTVGHVNNAVYVTYLEEARIAYAEEVFDLDRPDDGYVVAHLELSFERSIRRGETVTAHVWTDDVGRTSVTIETDLRVDNERAAHGTATIVLVDESGQPTPIPDDVRARIEEYEAA